MLIIFSGMFFGLVGNVQAACNGTSPNLTAASANYTDVKACTDIATYGDTVNIPACAEGDCVWTSAIDMRKDIKIIGAGVGVTNLINTTSVSDYYTVYPGIGFFFFAPNPTAISHIDQLSDTSAIEVSGISFIGNGNHAIAIVTDGAYTGDTSSSNLLIRRVKIHDNKFTSFSYPIYLSGNIYGVIYKNQSLNSSYSGFTYPYGNGSNSWNNYPMTLGSGDAIYLEDNVSTFTGQSALGISGAANRGSGHVMRYNTVTGTIAGSGNYWETHGNQWGSLYGPQITEVYGNNFAASGPATGAQLRGGKGIILYNIWASGMLSLREEQSDAYSTTLGITGACPENNPQVCLDSCICQKINHAYILNNRPSATGILNAAIIGEDSYSYGVPNNPAELVEDREFFNQKDSFDGTAGMGCGTLEQMNTITPTLVNAGFWVTNQNNCTDLTGYIGANGEDGLTRAHNISGTLYRWNGFAWANFYTPYTYPHPLRCSLQGDFDCNERFDATDIQTMINIILNIEKDSTKINQAKMNEGETVDASDLQILINKVLGIN